MWRTHQSQKFEKRVLLVPLPHFLGTAGRRDGPPGVIRLLQQNRGQSLQPAHSRHTARDAKHSSLYDDDAISQSVCRKEDLEGKQKWVNLLRQPYIYEDGTVGNVGGGPDSTARL